MYLQGSSERITDFFGFDWEFRLEEEESFRPVQLPHDWSVEYPFDEHSSVCGSGGYVKAGIGWYKKQFAVSPKSKGKRIQLIFDGAYMCSTVWLNGKKLGTHAYGYTPFYFDVTDIIAHDGENEIIVQVDNSRQPNSRWYTGSGITRDAWLCAINPVHIPIYGVFVRTKGNTVQISTTVRVPESERSQKYQLITSLLDGNNNICAEAITDINTSSDREATIYQEIALQNLNYWSHKNPYLYRAVTTIKCGDRALDSNETMFGVRTVKFDSDNGCFINGEHVKLRGVCLHHDGGPVGAAVPKKLWRRRLLLLKEMGANAIRTAHNPPDTSLLELCDELGFYVMDEAFDEWDLLKKKTAGSNTHESRGYSEWFKDNYIADIEAMVLRDRNHPSVIMWSIGNEVPEQTTENGHLLASELQDICRRLDPTRLCTQGNDQIFAEPNPATEEFLKSLDIVGYNYTGRWRKRAETLYYDDKKNNPTWLMLGTENPAAAGRRGDYRMDIPVSSWQRPYFAAPVNVGKLLRFTESYDYVIGDFMWTGIDHLGEAHWPNRSSSSGVIDTCGFPKDHFYFYKSVWSKQDMMANPATKPMIHLFPHRNLNEETGTVLPVLCYTNCTYVELFVNGVSYGNKASSFPLYGMTKTFGHFDSPQVAASTDDLFLSWDVPFAQGEMEAVGYIDGNEACRLKVQTAGEPAKIVASADTDVLKANGRDIAHIEIAFEDATGILNPVATNEVQIKVEGPAELIGIDNGKPDCHRSFKGESKAAYNGKLLGILRAGREAGDVAVTVSSDGLEDVVIRVAVKSIV